VGRFPGVYTTGILSEIHAAPTWQQAQPPHDPEQAAEAVRLLVEPPSMIRILPDSQDAAIRMFELAASHQLRATLLSFPSHTAAVKFDYAPAHMRPFGGQLFVALFGDERSMTAPAGPRVGAAWHVLTLNPGVFTHLLLDH
jgi:hypothetical protein